MAAQTDGRCRWSAAVRVFPSSHSQTYKSGSSGHRRSFQGCFITVLLLDRRRKPRFFGCFSVQNEHLCGSEGCPSPLCHWPAEQANSMRLPHKQLPVQKVPRGFNLMQAYMWTSSVRDRASVGCTYKVCLMVLMKNWS